MESTVRAVVWITVQPSGDSQITKRKKLALLYSRDNKNNGKIKSKINNQVDYYSPSVG